jgi:hypothetical protein
MNVFLPDDVGLICKEGPRSTGPRKALMKESAARGNWTLDELLCLVELSSAHAEQAPESHAPQTDLCRQSLPELGQSLPELARELYFARSSANIRL